ncbi:MAG: hypothetical protein RIQ89_1124 [Bacteroidota bacterium]|jgi:hypothetical protein
MKSFQLGIGSRVSHAQYGNGVIIQVKPDIYQITFMDHGLREVDRYANEITILDAYDQDQDLVSLSDIQELLRNLYEKFTDVTERVELAPKWQGGKILIQPADKELKPVEIPIEGFFNKIIMLRDRLRVLEQRINSNDLLPAEEKLNMQQYITRCYGSLTTFNVLFKYQTDKFTGEKKEKD